MAFALQSDNFDNWIYPENGNWNRQVATRISLSSHSTSPPGDLSSSL